MLTRENHNSHNTSGLRTTGVQNYAVFVYPPPKTKVSISFYIIMFKARSPRQIRSPGWREPQTLLPFEPCKK